MHVQEERLGQMMVEARVGRVEFRVGHGTEHIEPLA